MTVFNTKAHHLTANAANSKQLYCIHRYKDIIPAEDINVIRQHEMKGKEWGCCVCVCVCVFDGVCIYLERPQRTAGLRPRQPWPDTALTSCLAPEGSAAHQPV